MGAEEKIRRIIQTSLMAILFENLTNKKSNARLLFN
jgi:hypothetical protein